MSIISEWGRKLLIFHVGVSITTSWNYTSHLGHEMLVYHIGSSGDLM